MGFFDWIAGKTADALEGGQPTTNALENKTKKDEPREVDFSGTKIQDETEKVNPKAVDNAVRSGLLGKKSPFLESLDSQINMIFKAHDNSIRVQAETFMTDVMVKDGNSIECIYFIYNNRVRPIELEQVLESKKGSIIIADFKKTFNAKSISFSTLNGNEFNVAKMIIVGRMKSD